MVKSLKVEAIERLKKQIDNFLLKSSSASLKNLGITKKILLLKTLFVAKS